MSIDLGRAQEHNSADKKVLFIADAGFYPDNCDEGTYYDLTASEKSQKTLKMIDFAGRKISGKKGSSSHPNGIGR